ncbi:MAG: VanZ family protein [Eubacteriales bacterium]|jgi:VanZ family protein|nr:VanZ family protein [Eubacteriales bacterium]
MNRKMPILILILIIAATVVFIFGNSLTPGEISNKTSRSLSQIILGMIDPGDKINPEFFHKFVRKSAHFVEFALLGAELMLLTLFIAPRRPLRLIFMPLFLSLMTAVTDEFLQIFTTRTSSVADVLLDYAGTAFGIAAVTAIYLVRSLVFKKER